MLASWIKIPEKSDFTLENLPYGIGAFEGNRYAAVTRIGDSVVDLGKLEELRVFDGLGIDFKNSLRKSTLNEFIELGKTAHQVLRSKLQRLFSTDCTDRETIAAIHASALHPTTHVKMIMPVKVTDYTDFYSSIEHATNVGRMFRDPANALLPNWRHLPVAYHGRASSIVVSGTPIKRPKGQRMPKDATAPVFGPSQMMDFELEMAFVVSKSTTLGHSIPIAEAENYIFGFLLFNDLSARDIQSWEYVPLGPFLSKNFGSVVSPWIVTLDALEPFRTEGPEQEPEVLPYLKSEGKRNFDIQLSVSISPEGGSETEVCHSNFKYMYWNIAQQLAHHTVNGCNITSGDLYASGTISGPEPGSYGSMLELTWRGEHPLKLTDGNVRSFLKDNDEVIIRGYCQNENHRIGFGECRTTILPNE